MLPSDITAPQAVCDQYGADILRLWVVGTDYTEDQRIGPEILKHQAEAYRRLDEWAAARGLGGEG